MSVPSQADMIAALRPTLLEHGQIFKKTKRAFVRRAKEGELVQTILDGKVETENTAQSGDWIVRADTRWKECYILTDAKFANVYGSGSGIAIEGHPDAAELAAEGYLSYEPKARIRAVEATAEVLSQHIPRGCFIAAWGAEMLVEAGDFLAAPVSHDGGVHEVYRIERVAFGETYVPEGDS